MASAVCVLCCVLLACVCAGWGRLVEGPMQLLEIYHIYIYQAFDPTTDIPHKTRYFHYWTVRRASLGGSFDVRVEGAPASN